MASLAEGAAMPPRLWLGMPGKVRSSLVEQNLGEGFLPDQTRTATQMDSLEGSPLAGTRYPSKHMSFE